MPRRPDQRGMAMMFELLVGFAVLSVAVLAIFGLFPSSDRAAMRALRTNQANEFARKLVEETAAKHYSLIPLGETTGTFSGGEMTRNGSELRTDFFYKMKIAQESSGPVKDIEVEVYWLEGKANEKHSVFLESAKGEFW